MAQFARPDSNVTQTGFTGGFAEIDEASASDADFAFTADNTTGLLEVGLSDVSDPGLSTGHVLRYRLAKSAAGTPPSTTGNTQVGTVSLIQGTTVIAADVERTLGAWTTYSLTLSGAQADAITDYTDLRIRFDSPASGGGPTGNRRGGAISWAELEVPSDTSYESSLAGALSFAGAIAKRLGRAITGSLDFTGSTAKQTNRSLTGSASFTGTVTRQTARGQTATLTFTTTFSPELLASGTPALVIIHFHTE